MRSRMGPYSGRFAPLVARQTDRDLRTMNAHSQPTTAQPAPASPPLTETRRWVPILAKYRDPSTSRSLVELGITLVPFLAIWALAWWTISFSPTLAAAIAAFNGAFLVRLFIIQHDCGHGSFFSNRALSDWIGRALGILTLTPYDVWRRSHAIHHSAAGNLDDRGIGDVYTMTIDEYRAASRMERLRYRVYRHPLFLFGLAPTFLFMLQNRLPIGFMKSGWQFWVSSMGTNVGIALILGAVIYFGGIMPVVLVFFPTILIAASIGVWLFYVQHQFEETHWDVEPDWQLHHAALHGSSFYDLPPVMRWFSGNIGVHHVHHLYSRIPFYRLMEVLKDHPVLATSQRLTLRESLGCVKLQLWDAKERRLMSFAKARELYGTL